VDFANGQTDRTLVPYMCALSIGFPCCCCCVLAQFVSAQSYLCELKIRLIMLTFFLVSCRYLRVVRHCSLAAAAKLLAFLTRNNEDGDEQVNNTLLELTRTTYCKQWCQTNFSSIEDVKTDEKEEVSGRKLN
jgi:hypothetical protein